MAIAHTLNTATTHTPRHTGTGRVYKARVVDGYEATDDTRGDMLSKLVGHSYAEYCQLMNVERHYNLDYAQYAVVTRYNEFVNILDDKSFTPRQLIAALRRAQDSAAHRDNHIPFVTFIVDALEKGDVFNGAYPAFDMTQ